MLETLRSGAFLTRQRLYVYPILLLTLFAVAALALLFSSHAGIDAFGRPLGADFSGFFTAGFLADHAHSALAYDVGAFCDAQEWLFGRSDSFYVWLYPPYFLALAGLFSKLPYFAALAVWQATTLATYLATVLAILRPAKPPLRLAVIAALAFPAVFINLLHGQNGFLSAALLGGGLALLERRRLLAGIVLALLAYKPQFGFLLVPALLAGGYWRTCAAAAATLAAMTLASLAAFGTAPWQGFFANLHFTRVVVEQGAAGFAKNLSAFAAVRLLGGGVDLAYLVQGAVSGALLVILVLVWRSATDFRLKAAALLAASLLATPQVFDYDLAILAPALAFALAYGLDQGFGAFEKAGLAAIWIAPLLARPLGEAYIPFGAISVLLFFAGIVRCSRSAQARRSGIDSSCATA